MKRTYESGISDDVVFFTGVEVEKTPAFGLKTLFVTGLQSCDIIEKHYQDEHCEHIFFGANHSYKPRKNDEHNAWNNMIKAFLTSGKLCSLDIPINYAEDFLQNGLTEFENFIPQLRIPLPYVKKWNYNTMLKIDDKDFKASNPGVWCHNLHDLLDRNKFTDWTKYGLDKVLK
ncbi:MAG: hypothetical protein CMO59_14610 [Verrucomicrobiales bacterium]|nr:hypothetical protein [Verrucomicrobiales bacterium]|tara:strand:- start:219 stop:737 length:519 start_codon:yes stop_codon:yes gene_type:complete